MRKIIYTLGLLCIPIALQAQEASQCQKCENTKQQVQQNRETITTLKKLKISGYIQTQAQWGQEKSTLKVGEKRSVADTDNWNRIGIRRGRIKVAYSESFLSGVFQIDITEKGFGVKDVYIKSTLPKMGKSAVMAGLFLRPFGSDLENSSSDRESPERAMILQTLFPEERDLGIRLTLQTAKGTPLDFLKLDLGLISGNGIKKDIDSRKDFIAHLTAEKILSENIKGNLGFSYYNGSVYQGTTDVYTVQNGSFVVNSNEGNKGTFARREYFGLEGGIRLFSPLGMTHLRGEYLWGQQPGTDQSNKSPNSTTLFIGDTYLRKFNGWYAVLTQDFGALPLSAVVKYDHYDPNTNIAGDQLGQGNVGKTDVSYTNFGLGLIWKFSPHLKLQGYYDLVTNETSKNLKGYDTDLKDNVFTLRLQYKF